MQSKTVEKSCTLRMQQDSREKLYFNNAVRQLRAGRLYKETCVCLKKAGKGRFMRKNLMKVFCGIVLASFVAAGTFGVPTWNTKKALAEETSDADDMETEDEDDDDDEEEVDVDISKCKVTFDEDKYYYTGKAVKPEFTVSYVDEEGDDVDLEEGEDYSVTYSNNRKASKNAKIKIRGITDNCTGTLVKTFTISKAEQKITAKNASVSLGKKTTKLKAKCNTGKLKFKSSKPNVATIDSNGKLILKKKGKAVITIKAKGNKNYKTTKKTVTVTVK